MIPYLINSMIFAGSGLMVFNVLSYIRFSRQISRKGDWRSEGRVLYFPILLLVFFLLGYLAIGIFGHPDIIMAGILFGGSIFVAVMLFLIRHITQRIQENEQLEARLIAAEESSRTKSAFLASMSHEIRTPMNAIIGFDKIALKNPELSPETRTQLEKIGVSAAHLLDLINDILDMNRTDSGQLVLRREPFYFPDFISQINVIIGSQCEDKGLTYVSRVFGAPEDAYIGDPVRLRQVLINVLSNAVKFTDAGGNISFSAEQTGISGKERTLRFIVRDDGIGIDPDYIPKLFDAFSQEDASMTSRYGGSGLGLAVAKKLLDLMGGEISAESTPGQGSVFTITVTLPAAEADAAGGSPAPAEGPGGGFSDPPVPEDSAEEPDSPDAADSPDYAEDSGITDTASCAGRRILVVEDIDINAELLQDLLEMEEMESERAENGRIALDMFRASAEGYYDAVLMDLRMPEMDGLSSARAIRALDRKDAGSVPIIALTANAFEEDVRNSLEAGMDGHLAKPVDPDLLYDTLKKHFSTASSRPVAK